MTNSDSFPLKWPFNRPRTETYYRKHSPFKTSMARARDGILAELKRLGASQIVISTNIETYVRGSQTIPYADQTKQREDPGVALYYTWKGDQYCLACDKYKTVMDNMQAINKTIEAIRGIERWGTGEMMKTAFQGFKALPEADKTIIVVETPWQILGLEPAATADQIKAAYKAKIKIHHPDVGGNIDKFHQIKNAYAILTSDF